MLFPANNARIDAGRARQHLIVVNGRAVEYWTERSTAAAARPPRAFVLFFAGKGDRADRIIGAVAGAWHDRPVELWGMNYPGSGGSAGPACMHCITPDALAVYDAMRQVSGKRPIFIQAGSLGTAPALSVAARRPVAGLVLQNPAPLRQVIMGYYGWWNLWLWAGQVASHLPDDLDAVVNAAHVKARAVFVLCGADEVIPPRFHRLVVGAYAGPKRVILVPYAHHNDPLTPSAAAGVHDAIEWMWEAAMEQPSTAAP